MTYHPQIGTREPTMTLPTPPTPPSSPPAPRIRSVVRTRLRYWQGRLALRNRMPEFYEHAEAQVRRLTDELKAAKGRPTHADADAPEPTNATTANDVQKAARVVNDLGAIHGVRGARVVRHAVKHGSDQAYVDVAVGGSFYDPAVGIAQRISAALDPSAPPPQRWAPKYGRKKRRTLRSIKRFLDDTGRLRTTRFHRWTPLAVVRDSGEPGRRYLQWILDSALPDQLPEKDRRRILMALATVRLSTGAGASK